MGSAGTQYAIDTVGTGVDQEARRRKGSTPYTVTKRFNTNVVGASVRVCFLFVFVTVSKRFCSPFVKEAFVFT